LGEQPADVASAVSAPASRQLPGLPDIDRVAVVFPGWILGLSAWMVAPNPSLDGRTPATALLDGDTDLVVAVAAHHGA
jgi:hypothetical protein